MEKLDRFSATIDLKERSVKIGVIAARYDRNPDLLRQAVA